MKIPLRNDILVNLINKIFVDLDLILQTYQLDIILDEANRIIILKARGIGATLAISLKILLLAMTNAGKEFIIISQDQKAANRVMRYILMFYNLLKDYPIDWHCSLIGKGAKNQLEFTNNSIIYSFPSKPDAVRGCHGMVFWDELAFHPEDDKMRGAINGCLRPNHAFIGSSTPMEMGGVFYEYWTNPGEDWKQYFLDYTCNKVPGYLEATLKDKADAIKQGWLDEWMREYECKFIDGKTRLFEWSLIMSRLETIGNEINKDIFVDTEFLGIDFGLKISQSVVVGVGKDAAGMIRIPRIIPYTTGQNYSSQLDSMQGLIKNIKTVRNAFCDNTGIGLKLVPDLQASDIGYLVKGLSFTSALKEKMIMFLYSAMSGGNIWIPNNEELIKQLHGIKRTTTETGISRYKHEDGKDKRDDYVWAACEALQGYASGASNFCGDIETIGEKVFKRGGEESSVEEENSQMIRETRRLM